MKKKDQQESKYECLTYTVQHPVVNVATAETSCCAPFRSIPLKSC